MFLWFRVYSLLLFFDYYFSLLLLLLPLLLLSLLLSSLSLFHVLLFLVVSVQTNKNLKPTKTYNNPQNLQEPAKTYKNTEMNINTQQMPTQLGNTLAVPKATWPAQRHCGRVAILPYGVGDKGRALRR